jgi:hypothetical protein
MLPPTPVAGAIRRTRRQAVSQPLWPAPPRARWIPTCWHRSARLTRPR